MCFTDYITIDSGTPSRSGKYAVTLPGVSLSMLSALTTDEQADYEEFFGIIYDRAKSNLVSDVQEKLQNKFFVDAKLITRETSEFKESLNSNTGLAGVSIEFDLPKYARVHIISIGVDSDAVYDSPELELQFFEDDADGDLLHTVSDSLAVGRNTINVDRDFEVDKIFIAYDPESFDLYQTKHRDYRYENTCGTVKHVNGGGLNVKYVISCSIEKFVCENLNLFAQAFWYKIGQELVIERRFGEELSKFTTMTIERAEELSEFYQAQYSQALGNAIDSHKIYEDPTCFNCKSSVYSITSLP